MSKVFVGLVHYPIYNKNKDIITSSIANLDIHDIARCAATYNVTHYYLIHPLESQHNLIQDLLDFWQKGYGAEYNPDRKEALDIVSLMKSIADVQEEIRNNYPGPLYTVVTDARKYDNTVSYLKLHQEIEETDKANYLLLFGTGWGLTQEVLESCDYILEPIYGRGAYNHLSVRSAVAIILDRLLGEKWWK
ncbi:MAG: RNA methyltransferase [Peptococcia bacterium]